MSLACVFPGQGSQSVGMIADFLTNPSVASLVRQADAALGEPSLAALIEHGPAEDLALTTNTQPAMLLAGLASYQAWLDAGGRAADMVAGHSLGEYTALVACGALDSSDAFPLTRLRAQAMQTAVPVGDGTMAAILGLDDDSVRKACLEAATQTQLQVSAANFNAPAQVVIAGHTAAVQRACELAKEMGAKRALVLQVSAPFHSPLLKPAGEKLALALQSITLREPTIPLVNNVDVAVQAAPDQIRDALVRQSYSPVRWVEVVHKLRELGATHLIEFGPGKVLAGLAGRIDKSLQATSVYDNASLQKAMHMMREAA